MLPAGGSLYGLTLRFQRGLYTRSHAPPFLDAGRDPGPTREGTPALVGEPPFLLPVPILISL